MNPSFLYGKQARIAVPQVILTDWDDTLFNNEHFLIGSIEELIRKNPTILKAEFGSFVTEGKLKALVEDAVYKTAGTALALTLEQVVKPELDLQEVEDKLIVEYNRVKEASKDWLCKGSLKMIQEVERRGIPIGVVTNKQHKLVANEIERCGLGESFYSIMARDDVPEGKSKPNPYPIHLSLSKLSYKGPKDGVWFMGDSLNDMKAAVAAGCVPVYVGRFSSLDHETLVLIDRGKIMYCKGVETVCEVLKSLKKY